MSQEYCDNRDLLAKFESLGHDCEFGLLQRAFEVEPIGLFRWGGTHITRLIEALDNDFAGLGDYEFNSIVEISSEYYLEERRYGMSRHTHVFVDDNIEPEALLHDQLRNTRFYLRLFRETMEDGEKVFVYKDFDNAKSEVLLSLGRALSRHGPTRLLVVHERADNLPKPTVEAISKNVFEARIQRFGNRSGGWDILTDQWLKILRTTLSL